ncbi:aspartate-semialdehyde dehydrogenase [Paraliomyxa miuraensis]|uniref:aspartate-semialdehyde dehydrogenase n=1 Tax=Paraliomyxa miuraensis TaxID=376150 RepID=UPI002252EBA7|nr:aspartate-semialdehyde dehydrogenase [Paraliomyxa miuraensis]MCX4241691.1 aspartate-semialdehyde dehydrogenase [Paraliomyxa miuraensis]
MKICILGATGLVGRETLELALRAWPGAQLDLYASRDQTMELPDGRALAVKAAERLEQADAVGGDLAMVALDDDFSARYVPRLLQLGYRVVDKSNTYRMDPKVPLVVAGVNCHLLTGEERLAANPNCTTIPFALACKPLHQRYGLTRATLSTYQAISGAGVGPLDAFLETSRAGYAKADRLGQSFDPGGYPGNTVPHNGKTDDSGFSSEERKLMMESRKILDIAELPVSAQCCRVPVAVGHYINAWVELREKVSLEEIAAVLSDSVQAPFVRFVPGTIGEGLSALHCVHDRDRALVGRMRLDPRGGEGTALCLTVTADNLRLGAATNAVRMASRWFPGQDPELRLPG